MIVPFVITAMAREIRSIAIIVHINNTGPVRPVTLDTKIKALNRVLYVASLFRIKV